MVTGTEQVIIGEAFRRAHERVKEEARQSEVEVEVSDQLFAHMRRIQGTCPICLATMAKITESSRWN